MRKIDKEYLSAALNVITDIHLAIEDSGIDREKMTFEQNGFLDEIDEKLGELQELIPDLLDADFEKVLEAACKKNSYKVMEDFSKDSWGEEGY